MAAPLVPLKAGEKIGQAALRAVQNDLVVIGTQAYRRVVVREAHRKSKKYPNGQKEIVGLVPVDIEAHINPVGIGLGLLTLGGAALAAWIAYNGIHVPGVLGGEIVLIPGLKDDPAVQDWWQRYQAAKAAKQKPTCESLRAWYDKARASGAYSEAARARSRAKALGCEWA